MTKRWSSTRSDLTKTKRQASKERRYDPEFVKEIKEAAAAPPEATFDNVDDLLKWLNDSLHRR